jgi:arylsulfatase A-like enzyme
LGFLANVPGRFWTRAVLGTMTALAFSAALFHFSNPFNLSTAHATAGNPQSPNIVLIVLDTARADHFSSYGYSRDTTPNIDQFAKRGVLFENAYSASSWTLPSMLSMFTSLLPHQHGSGTDRAGEPRTLAEILSAGGYETAGFNANPYYGIVPWGLGRGFGTYRDSTGTMGYSLDAMRLGRDFIEPVSEELFQRSRFNQFTAHELNQEVYRWYDHRPERPFFLFLNYNDAHDPYEAPPPSDHYFGHASRDAKHLLLTARLNRVALPAADRDGVIASYDNCLHYIDSQVAELLSFLQSSPEWAHTYVFITADHGEGFGEHGTYSHGSSLYRELLHVPLIVVGPGVPAGARVADTSAARRIFSTVLEFAGLKAAALHRSSLSRLWMPGYAPNNPDEPTVSELFDSSPSLGPHGLITITTREWQLVHKSGEHRDELYHWTTDPAEQHNLADLPENEALLQHLEENLVSIIERSRRPWRDTSYLQALGSPSFSPDLEALKSDPRLPDGSLLPTGAGAAQTLFAPNAEIPKSNSKDPEKELLKTLPYDEP